MSIRERAQTLFAFVSTLLASYPATLAAETLQETPSALMSVGRMAGALLLVLLAFWACAWLVRILQNPANAKASGLRVVASLAVGNRERVLVVQVGEEQIMLGVTAQNINTLHVLSVPVSEKSPPDSSRFARQLGKAMGRGVPS